MGRELGWADGGDSGKPLLSLQRKERPRHRALPILHSTKSPGPWAGLKESESRNHKALSISLWKGRLV